MQSPPRVSLDALNHPPQLADPGDNRDLWKVSPQVIQVFRNFAMEHVPSVGVFLGQQQRDESVPCGTEAGEESFWLLPRQRAVRVCSPWPSAKGVSLTVSQSGPHALATGIAAHRRVRHNHQCATRRWARAKRGNALL